MEVGAHVVVLMAFLVAVEARQLAAGFFLAVA
jgi:hypothetical protein